jgi:diguanylate cyclase (GGDEF)-like protein/PAS domain S-box-containing protein
MNKIIKRFSKYIDFVLVFLFLFIVVLTLFIYNLTQINNKIKDFNHYLIVINNIKVLHNEFDSIIYNKATFINYDDLVSKTNHTYSLLDEIDNDKFYKEFGYELKPTLKILKNKWLLKHDYIERFKSNNSVVIGSLNYIIELIKNIKATNTIKEFNDILLIDNSLSTLFKLFINIEFDKNIIENSENNLSYLLKKYNNSDFKFLVKKYNLIINDLKQSSIIKDEYLNIDVKSVLELIELRLNEEYDKSIKKQKNLSILLFIVSIFFLIISLLAYIKSLKIKKELIAFKYAVENSDNSIVMTDKDRKITYVNESFEKVTGYNREDVLGKNPHILKSGKMPSDFYKQMNEILDRGEKWIGEFININKFGDIYYETASITPIITDGKIMGYLAIKLNITEYIKQQQKVEFIAYHDNLTLLPNRRSLEKKVNELTFKASNNKSKFAILFIDLDGFKMINDGLGHDIGDLLLKEIANRFKKTLRESDNVFRVGGDEFTVILEYTNDENIIETVANKIIKNVNKQIIIKNHSLQVGCSIGIAKFPQDAGNLLNLLKYSDTAMYKAKQNGKNRFEFYSRDLSNSVHTRLNIEQSLTKALQNNEFYLVYQPKYDLSTKKIFSVEALIRWNSQILGKISPIDFIYVAEEMGFINQLGLFVFRKACEDFKYLKDKTDIKLISINVSTIQLMNENFVNEILEIIALTKIPATSIGIEITETYIMKNIVDIQKTLQELRILGIKIIIDDFGTGYSSMQYLQKLPIDIIKIDKSFVDPLSKNDNQAIIKAIIAISKSFDYKTVAEGIETQEQEDILLNLGIDFGQGFLFSKPKTLDEF